jgi:hypothetical protein
VLENVQVRKDLFDEFKLPFNIIYGKIGKLHAVLPWRSLGSSPVTIDLEQLHLVITPKPESEWSHIDFNSFERRNILLQSFAAEVIEKFKNDGKEKQEDGYLDRLGSKIIDNL